MPAKPDLFGHVLCNYLKGDKTPYGIRRDDGWFESPENPNVYFKHGIYEIERKGMKHAKGLVLDVGLGAGRHALYFQKKGLKVVGIDYDSYCVKTAKARGVKTAFTEDIFKPNHIRKYTFDTIWLAGNNLGVAGTVHKLPKLFHILDKLTADNAVILATGFEVEKTTNPDHLAYHRRQRKKGKYPGQMKLRIEYKGLIGEWFQWLHVSSKLLKEALEKTPWKLGKLIRARDGHYLAVIVKKRP
ncbi:MAG: methyltransferase domain-containing protein [Candidatus Peregrinibacteria bacterium]|nr:methyltransferase domain-containing protein [Candidatus Peregrinibacteria bacterium]